ncbi:uncharacterized protein FIBRA_08263 [Fibroporia radiculosa]|uniref:Uncharacterized protein n=1 Tax=Fibroporia radiculosa TaxID=599839 RepID=J4H529_9APHY|nr:uncharacterized protein FIBRA_08263 [Fibroporia radiculosa]CCM06019.1 predicted protein [Fibroporia radiculosa]
MDTIRDTEKRDTFKRDGSIRHAMRQSAQSPVENAQDLVIPPAPVEGLSLDILHVIFAQAVSLFEPDERQCFAIHVASVCRAWRDAAVDTSSLWSTIYIDSGHLPSIAMLQLFLERSRNQKLDISIDWAHGFMRNKWNEEKLSAYIAAAMHALVPHMSRWETMDISWNITGSEGPGDTIEPLFVGNADALTYLSVYCFDHLPLREERRDLQYFKKTFTAPHLTTLVLLSMPSGFELGCLADCFPALEDLTWSEDGFETIEHWDTAHTFLQTCFGRLQRLRRLKVDGLFISDPFPERYISEPDLLTLLPTLERLEIERTDYHIFDEIMSAIRAPRLVHISVFGVSFTPLPVSSPFHGFLQQSSRLPALHSILVEATSKDRDIPDPDECWAMFGSLPCVRFVTISLQEFEDLLQSWCEEQSAEGWRFPRVTSLEIFCDSVSLPVSVLRTLVTSRQIARKKDPDVGLEVVRSLKIYTKKVMAAEEKRFFTENVQEFVWTSGLPPWYPVNIHRQPGYDHANRLAVQWVRLSSSIETVMGIDVTVIVYDALDTGHELEILMLGT